MSPGLAKGLSRFLEESSFVRHYLWKYKGWVAVGLTSLLIVDLLEVLPPILLKHVVDVTLERGPTHLLAKMALVYFGISLIQGGCRYAWRMYLIRSSILAGRDLREKYAQHLFGLSVSFFNRRRMGDLMSLAIQDVEAVRVAIGSGLLVFADALFYLLTVPVAMYLLSPRLTLLVCLPMPIIPFIVLRNEKKIHSRFEKVQECFGKISAITQENLNGIRVVKAFAKEDTQIQRIREAGNEYAELNLSLSRIQSSLGPSMDFVMSLGLVILLWIGGDSMIGGNQAGPVITLGTFVAFQRYIQKMVWPMSALGMAINYYQRSVSSSKRLKEVFSVSPEVSNAARPILPKQSRGHIEFKNLSFRFPGNAAPILKNVSFVVEPGERVAFVGGIGSGKSAILSLIPRLYQVDQNMIWIDGVDINDWPIEELRRQVGYVSQDIFLFRDTILENVAFGLHGWNDMTEPLLSVESAAHVASVHHEVVNLPSGYKTRLGERGANFSGGQRQRLTIARAVAKQPSILVLDDALSAVDVQTEEKILSSLLKRPGKNTEVIAAHRISTVKDADRIFVIQSGQIVQSGSHSQLIACRSGEYHKFYEQQQLKEDLDQYRNEFNKFN
jgi:ATP-binding cassette subfamily B protein